MGLLSAAAHGTHVQERPLTAMCGDMLPASSSCSFSPCVSNSRKDLQTHS